MNPVLLQKQLRENANDLQDFCKDLKSWGDDMKRKEDSLNAKDDTSKKPKVQTNALPKVKAVTKEKVSRIGSTDYAKWEKFNADLECERLEDDFKDDSELTDEFEESTRDEALVHKEKGNSYVKIKEWDKAIDCYTKAIKCYAYDPVFYANRALCYLKKDNYTAAEADCTLSLRLDSTYVKALQRRAAAWEGLGKLIPAATDLELVLTHEPKNKESSTALARIKVRLEIQKKRTDDEQRPVSKFTTSRNKGAILNNIKTSDQITPKIDTSVPSASDWPDPGCDIIQVKAINKPPHIRSTKPLKRIEITEVDVAPKPSEAFNRLVVEHVDVSEPVVKSTFKKIREELENDIPESINKTLEAFNSRVVEHIKQDANKSVFKENKEKLKNENARPKSDLENKPKEMKNTENIFLTKMDNKTASQQKDELDLRFSIPKTSVQFNSTWKTIKSPEDKYKYLKIIDPQEIPKVFMESLESSLFSGILDVLATSFIANNDEVYEYLFQFTKVKRFSALAMFMDSTDKNRLWKLITYLKEKGNIPTEQVHNLILEYEL